MVAEAAARFSAGVETGDRGFQPGECRDVKQREGGQRQRVLTIIIRR